MNPIWMVSGGVIWKILRKKCFLWYTSKGVTLKLKVAEKLADKIFTASPESFRIKSKKVIVTGHGIDTELFKPLEHQQLTTHNEIRILSVGRIAPVKNYEVLIEAAKILKDEGVKFVAMIVGETPLDKDKEYAKKIKLEITDYQLQNHFNFVGKVEHKNLPSHYLSHDIFVHLSKTGSLDKTLLEAMACGMNVLSSNDAAKAFLPPGLVFNENNAGELADKIKGASQHKIDGKLREFVVENHNLDNLIDKISGLINK